MAERPRISKRQAHRDELATLGPDWAAVTAYLTAHSNLPGPRGNLELADAFADWAPDALVDSLVNSGDEYLDFCAVLALGERLARVDDPELVRQLRAHAGDDRWRLREAVARGLQRVGDRDLPRLRAVVLDWAQSPEPLVQRAAVAAICEPRLLTSGEGAATALSVCSVTTGALEGRPAAERRTAGVRVLRQALGYCWSVAVAADPARGLAAFRRLQESADPDVAWIVRENERKARLRRVLAAGEG